MSSENQDQVPSATSSSEGKPANDDYDPSSYYLTGPKLYMCALSIVLCLVLSSMDQTIANTAIKGLESTFNEFSKIGWVTSAYMLPASVFALIWGRLGMLFGRRICLLISIFLFELGSLVSAVAPSMDAFIIGRAITGIGAAGIQTGALIVISEISPVHKRGLLLAGVTLSIVPSAVIGPLIGGAFTSSKKLTWRWCLYINLPFGGLAGIFLLLFYRPLPTKNFLANVNWKKWPDCIIAFSKTMDFYGAVLLTSSWVLILIGISFGNSNGSWKSAKVLCLLIIGIALFVSGIIYDWFLFEQTDVNIPLIPRKWILVRGVLGPAFTMMFGTVAFFGGLMYISVYFELVLNKSAFSAGLHLLPIVLAAVPCSILGGLLSSRKQIMKPLMVCAGPSAAIGYGLLTMFNFNTSIGAQIGYLIFVGMGFGLVTQPSMLSAQCTVKKDNVTQKLVVTAFLTYSRNLGSAIGGIVATAIYSCVANMKLTRSGLFGTSPDINNILEASDAANRSAVEVKEIDSALETALHAVFWFAFASCLVTFAFSLMANSDSRSREAFKNKESPASSKENGVNDSQIGEAFKNSSRASFELGKEDGDNATEKVETSLDASRRSQENTIEKMEEAERSMV